MADYSLVKEQIYSSAYTGLIEGSNSSRKEYQPKLLVNNSQEGKKVLTNLIRELKTCDAFFFSVAFITNSGVAALVNTLKELEYKKVPGQIIASQYENFTEPRALERLLEFENIELRILSEGNFHAKGYIFQKDGFYDLIIGSSNLTGNALTANKEWNLKITSSDKGGLIKNTLLEFDNLFAMATPVTKEWITEYNKIYLEQKRLFDRAKEKENETLNLEDLRKVAPNKMQVQALQALSALREEGKDKALLISATGTGKTYLSAFDVKKFGPKKFLFLIHRELIAKAAMKTYRKVFDNKVKMGLFTGRGKDWEADFLFATIQTFSKDHILDTFSKDYFDYIVMDEAHHTEAPTYRKILEHFKPKFLLGMTATPERTNGFNIFKTFDYQIAYEIRLHHALAENMLVPFHYYGVQDITVDGKLLEDNAQFNDLVRSERVQKILEHSFFYGCDQGRIRGLIFCSRVEEAKRLSEILNENGKRTIALCGEDGEEAREKAIERLEIQDTYHPEALDYILTVDIFNEGVDIPSINQIILLRPTQSAIVFIQQLGRGLRKSPGKEYLTIIDFIGNYSNNYILPIALYGDHTYNRDNLRKLLRNGSSFMPGASTINFDQITEQQIFEAISTAKLNTLRDLKKDYELLAYKLGRVPSLMDFVEFGSRDPYNYISYAKSYPGFLKEKMGVPVDLTPDQLMKMEFFSKEVCNGKRIEDLLLLEGVMNRGFLTLQNIQEELLHTYHIQVERRNLEGVIRYINGSFFNQVDQKGYGLVGKSFLSLQGVHVEATPYFQDLLKNENFFEHLLDLIQVAKSSFDGKYHRERYFDGFLLYEKYSRKDVCRILQWEKDESAVMYGYKVKYGTCPAFITYKKDEGVGKSTQYRDLFYDQKRFHWMSKNSRNLESSEIQAIRGKHGPIRIPFFVKKSDDEGLDFYFLGDVTPEEFRQETIENEKGKSLEIVNINVAFPQSIDDNLYDYLTEGGTIIEPQDHKEAQL